MLSIGSLLITPSMNLVSTSLKSKQIQSSRLNTQYALDGGSEYATWELIYGNAASQLSQNGEESYSTITLNGVQIDTTIRLSGASSGISSIPGSDDNKIRPSMTVECDQDGDGFDDDCLALPRFNGMVARYTVSLEQISPDISVGLLALYDEFPKGFTLIPGSTTSPDGSLPEIDSVTPTNIESQQWQIWKWDFSSSPIFFQHGEVKNFTFKATINNNKGRYCNGVFAKMEALPNEKSDRTTQIAVGTDPPEGCEGGGVYLVKYTDTSLARPNINTIVTYIINVKNIEQNSLHIDSIEDVLPPSGFLYCSPNYPPSDQQLSCDSPMWKTADEPFDPVSGDFTDVTGFTAYDDPQQTFLAGDGRWKLFWDGPGGSGWGLKQAGDTDDNFILRFQSQVTPTSSGTYFNEAFANVNCSAPSSLIAEGVTSQAEYCAAYSWPTSGVVVPSYDVRTVSGALAGQGVLVITGASTAQFTSWHMNSK